MATLGGSETPARGHQQVVAAAAIDPMIEVQEAISGLGRFQQRRAGAIAEEHRRGPVERVDDRAHEIRADDDHSLMGAAGDELRPGGQRVEEAGTCSREIEAPRARGGRADPG